MKTYEFTVYDSHSIDALETAMKKLGAVDFRPSCPSDWVRHGHDNGVRDERKEWSKQLRRIQDFVTVAEESKGDMIRRLKAIAKDIHDTMVFNRRDGL
ncbi:MAG: hypothetical protein WC205_04225 [Opitutaceae bacterium]